MAPLANERVVRSFLLGSSVLSIPLLIAACITARLGRRRWWGLDNEVIPIPFSFLTVTTSIVLSLLYFKRVKQEEDGKKGSMPKRLRALWAFLDLFTSLGYLGVLIPVWILEPRRLSTGAMMVETYASCFLIVNMVAHFYLASSTIKRALKHACFRPSECPHCHHQLTPDSPQMAGSPNGREGYSLLRGEIYLDEEEAPAVQGLVSHSPPTAEPQPTEAGVEGGKAPVGV